MSDDAKVQVTIAHANPLVAAGLRAAISADSELRLVDEGAHVLVTDYETGTGLMESGQGRAARILIVTDDNTEVHIRRAVELGAAGYLPLHSPLESVVRAVRCIDRGGTAIDPLALSKIAVSLASPALTVRETEVLRLMMQGLRDKAIAMKLKRTLATVKSHVKAILYKLSAASRVEAIAVARRRGLISEEGSTFPVRDRAVGPRRPAMLRRHPEL